MFLFPSPYEIPKTLLGVGDWISEFSLSKAVIIPSGNELAVTHNTLISEFKKYDFM